MSGILDFPDGSTWVIPDGWLFGATDRPTYCRSCNARVLWLTSKNGKKAPMNADGTSHFSDCPQAASWRKAK